MGSIISMINDDMDDYYYLCQKYNEKPQEVYSNHHRWLEDLSQNKTLLSFEEYDKQQRIKALEHEIKCTEEELSRLKARHRKLCQNQI